LPFERHCYGKIRKSEEFRKYRPGARATFPNTSIKRNPGAPARAKELR